jgi:hypothetical protein
MNAPWRTMTKGDWLIILVLLGASLLGIAIVASAPAGARVLVTAEGDLTFSASLDQRRQFAVAGPLGKTQLTIDDSGVRVLSSPCPRKICMNMGPARGTADLIACVPNRILVRIEDADHEEAAYDLLSR